MTRTVWKYDLDVVDVQKVSMPIGAMPLHVAIQQPNAGMERTIQLWAAVDPAMPKEDRLFAVVGTGNPAPEPDEAEYIGSVMDGPFVWHVFRDKYARLTDECLGRWGGGESDRSERY